MKVTHMIERHDDHDDAAEDVYGDDPTSHHVNAGRDSEISMVGRTAAAKLTQW
jgi:hypothetical protein